MRRDFRFAGPGIGAELGGTTPPMTTTADDRGDRDQDHDYGWIGLLGLACLGGLIVIGRRSEPCM